MNKQSLLSHVLKAYVSACASLASLRQSDPKDAVNLFSSALISNSYSIQLSIMRNILAEADLSPADREQIEPVLKEVEAKYPANWEIITSVQMIRESARQPT